MKHFRNLFFLCALLVSLTVSGFAVYAECTGTLSPVRYITATLLAPLQNELTSAGNFFEDLVGSVAGYRALEEENDALRAQISAYDSQIREADAILEENNTLRELLQMKRRYTDYEMLSAEVIASESGAYGVTYTLNRGTEDGVAPGNAVIIWEGMVGAVTAAGPNWCEMISILDADFRAGALISRNQETSVLQGDPTHYQNGELLLVWLPQESEARQSDRVVTSGLGGLYPPNLFIGRITALWEEADGLSCSAVVKPTADFVSLRRVYIITDFLVSE